MTKIYQAVEGPVLNEVTIPSVIQDLKNGRGDYTVRDSWFGAAEFKGCREIQQDRILVEQFDPALSSAWNALTHAQKKQKFLATFRHLAYKCSTFHNIHSGSTALVVVYNPNTQECTYANLGDGELVPVELKANGNLENCQRLNDIHHPNSHKEFVRLREGGYKQGTYPDRLPTGLAVSRAFGDCRAFGDGLIAIPDVDTVSFAGKKGLLLAACDGLSDRECAGDAHPFSYKMLGEFIADKRKNNPLDTVAALVAKRSINGGSGDNVSTILINLDQPIPEHGEAPIEIFAVFDGHGEEPTPSILLAEHFLRVFSLHVHNNYRLLWPELMVDYLQYAKTVFQLVIMIMRAMIITGLQRLAQLITTLTTNLQNGIEKAKQWIRFRSPQPTTEQTVAAPAISRGSSQDSDYVIDFNSLQTTTIEHDLRHRVRSSYASVSSADESSSDESSKEQAGESPRMIDRLTSVFRQ